jgi:mercuric ion transport protein
VDDRTLPKAGIAGAVVAALCCATPVFVILLAAVGFSAWVGWVDYVLIPAFVVCIGLAIYTLKRPRAEAACCVVPGHPEANTSGGRR